MSPRTVEQVDDWNTVPFSGGYGGLRDLATSDFSGVVTAGPTRLFMLRGSVVGVLDGSIDDFEAADGTAREAPHPALPLLAVMQERSDEVRAKYYTEETPLREVDETLADGGFTGYVELAENVLSGDYYQVYHQGRSMSVAYVGSSERLITDDEAFDQADGEVGIFEVRPVDIEVIDIPDGGTDAVGGDAGTAGAGGVSDPEPSGAADPSPSADTDEGTDRTGTSTGSGDDGSFGSANDPPDDDSEDDPLSGDSGGDRSVSGGDAVTSKVADAGGSPTRGDRTDSTAPASEETTTVRDDRDGSTRERRSDAGADAPAQESRSRDDGAATEERSDDGTRTDARATDATSDVRSADAEPDTRTTEARTTDARSTDATPDAVEETDAGTGTDTETESTTRTESPRRTSEASTGSEEHQSRTDASRSSRSEPSTEAPSDASASIDTPSAPATDAPAEKPRSADAGAATGSGDGAAGSAADLETRSIPSLDPARTGAASTPTAPDPPIPDDPPADDGSSSQSTPSESTDSAPNGGAAEQQRSTAGSTSESRSDPEPAGGASAERVEELETELGERRRELEDLEATLATVEEERDELREERDALARERDDLRAQLDEARAEIEQLESRLDSVSGDDPTAGAETRLSAREAIEQTNLFVRYRSKGEATLERAHNGEADRSAVEENLRLEYHTQFDADSAAVGDETFDAFLTGTIQYRFVDWLVGSLLYEIRDTGHEGAMKSLYDALPKIDRAELNGQVSVEYTEDGETHRTQEQFDVVVRDRMGNPLVVANINDSRDPATDSMMTDLVTRGERVGHSSESLAGAFLVTESFFEPGALETAEEATSSGLLSRDKRKSFVNLSRKDGYHLCLLEARNREFHLAVPEL